MEDNINNYKYDDSVEDLKLKAFVEQAIPQKMDTNSIKQKTFMKIHDEQRRLRRRQWVRLSVAACTFVAFICIGVWKVLDTYYANALTAYTEKAVEIQHVVVPVGEKMTIMLSDGTKLVANSRTKLSYPKTFQGAEQREVSIPTPSRCHRQVPDYQAMCKARYQGREDRMPWSQESYSRADCSIRPYP